MSNEYFLLEGVKAIKLIKKKFKIQYSYNSLDNQTDLT